MFTVSEELLAKVVEAVQAGEKKARSSGDIQSFEVFYHGFRQNVSCGRIYIVPPAVCNDRKNFPTALLYGCVVRVFGGEEMGDLIEKKIGDSEFDEYSQLDFDTLKEELFGNEEGKEACLVVYAPNWHCKREYIAFHFTKDAEQLKNNLRHQVFSAYYDPRVSSAFNAMMTNVDTTKVDVTDITPKMNFPALGENHIKQYPLLMKQASGGRPTVLLNHKTADDVTKSVLEPQELDVFDSLNQALEKSLMPAADGAQGEGGFKAPASKPGVPREASKSAAAGDETETNLLAAHESPISNVGPGTEAAEDQKDMVQAMKDGPQDMAKEGETPHGIDIDGDGLPIHKGDDEASGKIASDDKTAKRTKGMLPLMDIKPGTNGPNDLSGKMMDRFRHGGYVEREHPQAIRDHAATLATDQQAPQSIKDHSKEIQAGLYGDQGLSKSATEKWGNVKIAVNFKAKDQFTDGYLTAALWSSNDNSDPSGGEPLDSNYSIKDLSPSSLAAMERDCAKFQSENADLLQQAYEKDGQDDASQGHDFWLTRNGHGAGFWDGDYPQTGDALTEAAKAYGEQDIYVGDNGWLYVYGEEGDEQLEPQNPKNYNPTEQDLGELRSMGIQGGKQAKQARDASYVASKMAKIVDSDGGYEAASPKTKKARAAKEAKLENYRSKEAVSLDIDSIWADITEDMGPAPLIDVDVPAAGGEQVAEGGDNDKPAGSGGRPNKRDVGDLPESFKSDEPEDEKSMSDSEADAQEDSTPESKEAAWRVDNNDYHGPPKAALAKAQEMLDALHGNTLLLGDSGVVDGWWVETHTLGCRDAADEPEERWQESHDRILDEYRNDGMSHVILDDSGIFVTMTPQRAKMASGTFTGEQVVDYVLSQHKYADFVSDLFDETQINEGGPSSESLRAAEEAIQNDDDIIYDVAANAGQMVDNVRHMEWFRDAVAEAIEEQGQADAAQAEGEAFADEDQEVLYQPEQRTGSSKKADTADNDVNIDGAANPPSKETGDSKTVGQHKQYDQQQNKGGSSKKADTADNPANEDGGEGAIRIKTNKEITNTRGKDLPSANPIGGKNSAKKVADTADNPDNMTDGPGTKIKARAVVSDTSGPTPVNTKQGGKKQADTADNPANWKGGEGIIQPKTDADIKDTSGPDCKCSADVSGDIAEAKSEVVSPGTVDKDIQQPAVDAKSAAGVEGDMSEAKSELTYGKSEMADEPLATDTVNPEHFAGDDRETCAYCDQKFDDNEDHICPKRADWSGPWECDNCSNYNAGSKCLRCGAKKPGGGGGELPAGKSEPKSETRGEPRGEKQPPKSGPKGEPREGAIVRMPQGVHQDPDNAAWTNRFEIKSESSDRLYRIAQNKSRGYWACSCPGWISRRCCKHLKALGLPCNEQPYEATLKAGSLSKDAFDAKLASYADEYPEEAQIDFGGGDLAGIVLTEDESTE
jgi:hypothetical protein